MTRSKGIRLARAREAERRARRVAQAREAGVTWASTVGRRCIWALEGKTDGYRPHPSYIRECAADPLGLPTRLYMDFYDLRIGTSPEPTEAEVSAALGVECDALRDPAAAGAFVVGALEGFWVRAWERDLLLPLISNVKGVRRMSGANMTPIGCEYAVGDAVFRPETPRGVLADQLLNQGRDAEAALLRSNVPVLAHNPLRVVRGADVATAIRCRLSRIPPTRRPPSRTPMLCTDGYLVVGGDGMFVWATRDTPAVYAAVRALPVLDSRGEGQVQAAVAAAGVALEYIPHGYLG